MDEDVELGRVQIIHRNCLSLGQSPTLLGSLSQTTGPTQEIRRGKHKKRGTLGFFLPELDLDQPRYFIFDGFKTEKTSIQSTRVNSLGQMFPF